MIRLDVSTTSIVVKCSECPHWYAFAWTREAGYTSSEQHLVDVHGIEPNQAAEARRSFLRRHAER